MSFKRSIRILLIFFVLGQAMPAQAAWYDGWGDWFNSKITYVTNYFDTNEKKGWGIVGLAVLGLLAFMGFTSNKEVKKSPDKPKTPPPSPKPKPVVEPIVLPVVSEPAPQPAPAPEPVVQADPEPLPVKPSASPAHQPEVPQPSGPAPAAPALPVPMPAVQPLVSPENEITRIVEHHLVTRSGSPEPQGAVHAPEREPVHVVSAPADQPASQPASPKVAVHFAQPPATPERSIAVQQPQKSTPQFNTPVPMPLLTPTTPHQARGAKRGGRQRKQDRKRRDLELASVKSTQPAAAAAAFANNGAPVPTPTPTPAPVAPLILPDDPKSPNSSDSSSRATPPGSPLTVVHSSAVSCAAAAAAVPALPVVEDHHPFERYYHEREAAIEEQSLFKEDLLRADQVVPTSAPNLAASTDSFERVELNETVPPGTPTARANAIAATSIVTRRLITPSSVKNSKERIMLVGVHGTWSTPAAFGQDDDLEATRGIIRFAHTLAQAYGCAVEIVSFQWSGALSADDRNNTAAHGLVNELNRLFNNAARKEKIKYTQLWSIAHSHGCNVVNRAAELLAKQTNPVKFQACVHIASPQPDDAAILHHQKRAYLIYSTDDFTQALGSWQSAFGLSAKRKYPGNVYNIRLLHYGKELNHIGIKAPAIDSLASLIYMVDTTYPIFYDLEADVVDGKAMPLVAIRNEASADEYSTIVTPELARATSSIYATINPTSFQFSKELAALVAAYIGSYQYTLPASMAFSNEQRADFSKRYGGDMSAKRGLLAQVTMLVREASTRDLRVAPGGAGPTSSSNSKDSKK